MNAARMSAEEVALLVELLRNYVGAAAATLRAIEAGGTIGAASREASLLAVPAVRARRELARQMLEKLHGGAPAKVAPEAPSA